MGAILRKNQYITNHDTKLIFIIFSKNQLTTILSGNQYLLIKTQKEVQAMPQTAAPTTNTASPPPLFDGSGYLIDHLSWSEQLARDLAQQEGVGELSEQHWQVLRHIRERYLSLGALPNMRQVCRATGIPRWKVHNLFGSCLSIWRIAGLPDPGEEAKAYLS